MENNLDDVVDTDIVLMLFIDDADVAVFVSVVVVVVVVVVIIVGEIAELAKLL